MAGRVLITGGGGFLGSAVARRFAERGDAVRSFSRGDYPHLRDLGVEQIRGDVADADAVRRAAEGCRLVVHVAAKAGVWGPLREYRTANVVGTENVIAACRSAGVPHLVYTSSPSVTFAGRDQEGADESEPYPRRSLAHYPATKAEAERLVIAANDDALKTVSLRPHLIWGPGDPHLLPRLAARAKAGRLRRVGRAENRVDATYIDNAADAHTLAADTLTANKPVGGRAYFIANGEPAPLWDFINKLLATQGISPVTRSVPAGLAYAVGRVMEWAYRLLPGEPPMTRFVARQLATAHWFDLSAAERDLGYRPTVSTEEGLRRLAAARPA